MIWFVFGMSSTMAPRTMTDDAAVATGNVEAIPSAAIADL
jgi:hypothetical protein